jgi:hypothetical protein
MDPFPLGVVASMSRPELSCLSPQQLEPEGFFGRVAYFCARNFRVGWFWKKLMGLTLPFLIPGHYL